MTNRPKIKVPLQPLDIIVDVLSISVLICMIIYSVIVFQELPDTIPTHFDFKGEADSYGSKSSLFLLPGIGIVLFSLLFILNKYPHLHNYMVNITEENALKNYRFSTRVLRFTNLCIAILFFFIQFKIVQTAKDNSISIGNWLIPLIIGITVIVPIFLVVHQFKMNK